MKFKFLLLLSLLALSVACFAQETIDSSRQAANDVLKKIAGKFGDKYAHPFHFVLLFNTAQASEDQNVQQLNSYRAFAKELLDKVVDRESACAGESKSIASLYVYDQGLQDSSGLFVEQEAVTSANGKLQSVIACHARANEGHNDVQSRSKLLARLGDKVVQKGALTVVIQVTTNPAQQPEASKGDVSRLDLGSFERLEELKPRLSPQQDYWMWIYVPGAAAKLDGLADQKCGEAPPVSSPADCKDAKYAQEHPDMCKPPVSETSGGTTSGTTGGNPETNPEGPGGGGSSAGLIVAGVVVLALIAGGAVWMMMKAPVRINDDGSFRIPRGKAVLIMPEGQGGAKDLVYHVAASDLSEHYSGALAIVQFGYFDSGPVVAAKGPELQIMGKSVSRYPLKVNKETVISVRTGGNNIGTIRIKAGKTTFN